MTDWDAALYGRFDDEKVGLLNFALISLGLVSRGIPFLDSFQWAMPAVIVAAIWQILGFFMIILLAGLRNIPRELRPRPSHYARLLGIQEGAWKRWRRSGPPVPS